MAFATFDTPQTDRFFEDFVPGNVYQFDSVLVSEAEIIEFASKYDPQYFHTDPAAAKQSYYGGIIASGWHTGSMLMRCLVENYVSLNASLGSPGVENMRWPNPVRGGDTLTPSVTVVSARTSRSNPNRGIVVSKSIFTNQRGEIAMEMTAANIILRRNP